LSISSESVDPQAIIAAPLPQGRDAGLRNGILEARKLVAAHGGDIGIESAPGEGTGVTVSLPR
jgi:hypothetical protein